MRSLSAANRVRGRKLAAALLLSLGTAVSSGAVGVLTDTVVNGGAYHVVPIVVLTVVGLALAGTGSWLAASIRTEVAIAIAAMDPGKEWDTYDSRASKFFSYGRSIFLLQTTVSVPVATPDDLPRLYAGVANAILTLTRSAPQARRIGLYFQGGHHAAFHVGQQLGVDSVRKDIFHYTQAGDSSHFQAIRLIPNKPRTAASPLDVDLYLRRDGKFGGPRRVNPVALSGLLEDLGGPVGLAVNLSGAVDEGALVAHVKASAEYEQATAFVAVGLPASDGGRLPDTLAGFESAVAAVCEVADQIKATQGLLYMKTPAAVAVALGHFMRNTWIPMRHLPNNAIPYERFGPGDRAAAAGG